MDISKGQLARARRRLDGGRRPHLRFDQRDIMELDGLDGTFDAVVCLDAACYLPDRVLRWRRWRAGCALAAACSSWTGAGPNARLPCSVSFCSTRSAGCGPSSSWKRPAATGGSWSRPASRPSRSRTFPTASGPNWERGYRAALSAVSEPLHPGHIVSLATSVLRHGPDVVRAAKDQFNVALLAKAAADCGALRYVLACASRR